MRELGPAVQREGKQHAGDEPRAAAPGELANEQEAAESRQDERGEEQQVVAEDRVARDRVHRQDLKRLRDQMLGVRERQRCRVKDVRIEESRDAREIAAGDREKLLRVPGEDPHVEERIAEIRRHVASETARKRPRQDEREEQVRCGSDRRLSWRINFRQCRA